MRIPRPLIQRPRSDATRAYRAARHQPLATLWREARFAVVDLETTGLDPRRDEIISYAVVPIDHGRIPAGAATYGLVRPFRMPEERSIVVHGILPADLADAPPLAEAVDRIAAASAGRTIIAHAAWFERAFLGRAFRTRGVRLREPLVDTAVTGRLWLHERDGYLPRAISLASLVRALGLPGHRPHHALGDAVTTAQAFLSIATHLDAGEPQTIASLARAGDRVAAIARLAPASGEARPRERGRLAPPTT